MNKKQKKVLVRIIIAAVLMIVFGFLPVSGYLRFGLYMIPYLVIGYDILRKAWKGILNRQIFDENFLMAVATIGAIVLGEYTEGVAVTDTSFLNSCSKCLLMTNTILLNPTLTASYMEKSNIVSPLGPIPSKIGRASCRERV